MKAISAVERWQEMKAISAVEGWVQMEDCFDRAQAWWRRQAEKTHAWVVHAQAETGRH